MNSLFRLTLIVIAGVIAGEACAQETARDAAWREDIEHLREQAPRVHVNLFHTIEPTAFHSQLDELSAQIAELTDAEVLVSLADLISDIGDGHTEMDLGPADWNDFGRLPVSVYRFKGELRVTTIDASHPEAAGGRIISIGGHAVETVYARIGDLVSRDTPMWLDEIAARYITVPEVLHALAVIEDPNVARFEIERLDGERVTLELERVEDEALYPLWNRWHDPDVEAASHPMISARDRASRAEGLQSSHHRAHWYEFLAEEDAVYVRLDRISHPDDQSLEDLLSEAIDLFHEQQARRFIIDLRHNHGGNNYLNRPLLARLTADEAINRDDVLAIIIGRATYSAASHLVTLLESYTQARFYGEATGAAPNHYGDAKPIFLPNSGVRIGFSGMYWQNARPYPFEQRVWTDPDIVAVPDFEMWRANRDPALEAILSGRTAPDPVGALENIYDEAGLDAALTLMERQRDDPALQFRRLVNDHRIFVGWLVNEGEPERALRVALALHAVHPDSLGVMRDLGELNAMLDRPTRAREWYERAAAAAPNGLAYGWAHVSLQDL